MRTSELIKKIKQGKLFIYPTDTIYGLGCDAGNVGSVEKIKKIKRRDRNKPLSVIVPSVEWIKENLIIDNIDLDKYFPGAYTLVLKKKNKDFLKHVSVGDSLGVRIPSSKFCDKIRKADAPFITTSVNLSGQSNIKSIGEIPEQIKKQVDEIIDAGELTGNPSTLVINGREVRR